MIELACKPGSVVNSHSSRSFVTETLKRPTRIQCGPHHRIPIWSCSKWGLPSRGMLPPARCALTAPFHPYRLKVGGLLSAALSVGSRPPGVTWHLALWSPDFPPAFVRRPATVRLTLMIRLCGLRGVHKPGSSAFLHNPAPGAPI